MPRERGQATIDYVALIAVLAVVLAAAAALAAGGGPGVANAVLGQVRHALCIVTGRACRTERRLPCVIASERDARHVAVTILLVRLDGDRYVLRETMSDGTVRLTLAHRGGAGVELGVGARVKAALKGRVFGVDDEARAGARGRARLRRGLRRPRRSRGGRAPALAAPAGPADRRRRPRPERALRRGRRARAGPDRYRQPRSRALRSRGSRRRSSARGATSAAARSRSR